VKKLIRIKKPADTMLERGALRHPFLAVEMNDDARSLYIADLPWDAPLAELREKAKAFAESSWRRCYLELDAQRCLCYDLDGLQHVKPLPSERRWYTCVPVYDWSEVPL
jgi:hypothetical protein